MQAHQHVSGLSLLASAQRARDKRQDSGGYKNKAQRAGQWARISISIYVRQALAPGSRLAKSWAPWLESRACAARLGRQPPPYAAPA